MVRALDRAGNYSDVLERTLIVDVLPPTDELGNRIFQADPPHLPTGQPGGPLRRGQRRRQRARPLAPRGAAGQPRQPVRRHHLARPAHRVRQRRRRATGLAGRFQQRPPGRPGPGPARRRKRQWPRRRGLWPRRRLARPRRRRAYRREPHLLRRPEGAVQRRRSRRDVERGGRRERRRHRRPAHRRPQQSPLFPGLWQHRTLGPRPAARRSRRRAERAAQPVDPVVLWPPPGPRRRRGRRRPGRPARGGQHQHDDDGLPAAGHADLVRRGVRRQDGRRPDRHRFARQHVYRRRRRERRRIRRSGRHQRHDRLPLPGRRQPGFLAAQPHRPRSGRGGRHLQQRDQRSARSWPWAT